MKLAPLMLSVFVSWMAGCHALQHPMIAEPIVIDGTWTETTWVGTITITPPFDRALATFEASAIWSKELSLEGHELKKKVDFDTSSGDLTYSLTLSYRGQVNDGFVTVRYGSEVGVFRKTVRLRHVSGS